MRPFSYLLAAALIIAPTLSKAAGSVVNILDAASATKPFQTVLDPTASNNIGMYSLCGPASGAFGTNCANQVYVNSSGQLAVYGSLTLPTSSITVATGNGVVPTVGGTAVTAANPVPMSFGTGVTLPAFGTNPTIANTTFGATLNVTPTVANGNGVVPTVGGTAVTAANPTPMSFGTGVTLPAFGTNPTIANTTFGATGSISDASSGVATASTNLPTVAYNYGFNGTTWDQLQVDASKNLKVVLSVSPTIANTTFAATAVLGGFVSGAIADLYAATPPTPYAGSGVATAMGELEGIRQGILGNADPCNSAVRTIGPVVNFSSATTTLIANHVTGKNLYACELQASPNGAVNAYLVSGHGTNCGTGTTTISLTYYMANAGNGLDVGKGITSMAVTVATGDDICMAVSASTPLSAQIITVPGT